MKYGVGIDVSKGKSTISILSVEGEVIEEPFEINHDLSKLNLPKDKINYASMVSNPIKIEYKDDYKYALINGCDLKKAMDLRLFKKNGKQFTSLLYILIFSLGTPQSSR